MRLFHLVDPHVWAAAATAGRYAPPSLSAEGFVHCSFAEQVAGSANKHCADAAELVALELDPAAVGDHLVIEDSHGSGTAFPHVYAALDPAWVLSVHPVTRGEAGAWHFTPTGAAPAG